MPAGRPKAKIDQKEFEKLCALQCTLVEIAGWFSVSEDTIERWCADTYKCNFAEIYAQKRGVGKVSLRRTQWKMAETNPSMAIFLGKQYLGQKDKPEEEDNTAQVLIQNMTTLTETLSKVVPNRNIGDLE